MSYFSADEALEKHLPETKAETLAPAKRTSRTASAMFAADEALETATPGTQVIAATGDAPPATDKGRRTAPAPPALPGLDEIDAALAANSALLGPNGVFVKPVSPKRRS